MKLSHKGFETTWGGSKW